MILKPPKGAMLNRGHNLSKGLVGLWLMNEGTGNKVYDLSGNGNTGSLEADTHFVPGKFGPALDFDGTGDYVNVGILPTLIKWTVKFVAMPSVVSELDTVFSNDAAGWNDDVLIGIDPENQGTNFTWGMVHQDSVDEVRTIVEDTVVAVVNTYYDIAFVSDGLSLKIYVDGILKATTPKAGTALTFNGAITYIGESPNAARAFPGIIDHTMLYNRALSQQEIQQLYIDPFGMFGEEF